MGGESSYAPWRPFAETRSRPSPQILGLAGILVFRTGGCAGHRNEPARSWIPHRILPDHKGPGTSRAANSNLSLGHTPHWHGSTVDRRGGISRGRSSSNFAPDAFIRLSLSGLRPVSRTTNVACLLPPRTFLWLYLYRPLFFQSCLTRVFDWNGCTRRLY